MCNCLPDEGDTDLVYCEKYDLWYSALYADLKSIGRCYADSRFYAGSLRECYELTTELTPQGMCASLRSTNIAIATLGYTLVLS